MAADIEYGIKSSFLSQNADANTGRNVLLPQVEV
jgi:hypothetical protein